MDFLSLLSYLLCLIVCVCGVDHSPTPPSLSFTPVQLKSEYKSPKYYSNNESVAHMGMGFLYQAVRMFVHNLQTNKFPSYLLKDGDLSSWNEVWRSFRDNYVQWLKYEQGFLICSGICLLVCTVFALIYILYLCCRCCCCRKVKDKVHADRSGDMCRRLTGNICLTLIALAFVFLTATSFLSNQYVHAGVQDLPDTLRSSVGDASAYRDNSIQFVRKVLVDDYKTFNRTVFEAIDTAAAIVVHRVKEVSGAISIDKLASISDRASGLEHNLSQLSAGLTDLEDDVKKLRQNLSRLSESLSKKLTECSSAAKKSGNKKAEEECDRAFVEVAFYSQIPEGWVDMTQLKPLQEELRRISQYNVGNLLKESKHKFSAMQNQLQKNIEQREDEAIQRLNEISVELLRLSDNVAVRLEQIDLSEAYQLISESEPYLDKYEPYRWVGGIVISCLLAVITFCYAFGLFYGICGKRPNYYDDDCCIRSTGSKLYCMALVLSFLQLLLLMCVVICLFLFGANTEMLGCDPMKHPSKQQNSVLISYVESMVENQIRSSPELRKKFPELTNLNMSLVLEKCSQNKSFLSVIDLEVAYPELNEWLTGKTKSHSDLELYLDSILGEVDSATKDIGQLLPADTEAKLRELQSSSTKLNGVPAALIPELRAKIRSFDVAKSVIKLETEKNTASVEAKSALGSVIDDLTSIEENAAKKVREHLEYLVANLTLLDVRLPNLTADIPRWVLLTKNAENLLANNLTGYIKDTAETLSKQFRLYVVQYTDHVKYQFEHTILSCEPVANLIYNSMRGVCDYALDPFNLFWASVGIFLLLTIPAMMIVTSLRSLYRRTEPYSAADYAYSSWRTPTNCNYADNVGSPPPPYTTAKERSNHRWR